MEASILFCCLVGIGGRVPPNCRMTRQEVLGRTVSLHNVPPVPDLAGSQLPAHATSGLVMKKRCKKLKLQKTRCFDAEM